jgi:hypothetical protein
MSLPRNEVRSLTMADEDDEPSRRGPLIGLVVIVVIVLGGLWLTHVIHGSSAIQDCVMSGRTNCAPIQK